MRAVLVVDDDADIRAGVRAILEEEGYRMYEAREGGEALRRLRERGEGLVVLFDLNMPGVDGVGVLRAVAADKALARRHAYILFTARYGRTMPLDVVGTLAHLHIGLLSKPFELDDLLREVAQAAHRIP